MQWKRTWSHSATEPSPAGATTPLLGHCQSGRPAVVAAIVSTVVSAAIPAVGYAAVI
ncbi:hypothetical protein ACFFX0_01665 [Citricoccus parietis]|uniref:Uncharacterized protein n=1 Tax=Citricoccus parietis TaxID=592307 RepID=A0ABV5FTL8_9MICC